jgi:hypothetical protein
MVTRGMRQVARAAEVVLAGLAAFEGFEGDAADYCLKFRAASLADAQAALVASERVEAAFGVPVAVLY